MSFVRILRQRVRPWYAMYVVISIALALAPLTWLTDHDEDKIGPYMLLYFVNSLASIVLLQKFSLEAIRVHAAQRNVSVDHSNDSE